MSQRLNFKWVPGRASSWRPWVVGIILLVIARPTAGQCPFAWRAGEGLPGLGQSGGPGSLRAMTTWDPDGVGPAQSLLIAGGTFISAGNVLAENIVSWNGTSWQSLGAGMNSTVASLAVYNGELIAAGYFTTAGGASRVASPDGTARPGRHLGRG